MISFKYGIKRKDFYLLHPGVLAIYGFIANISLNRCGLIPSITSTIRLKTTDSGIHEVGCALDCSRMQYEENGTAVLGNIPTDIINEMVQKANEAFPRHDKYKSVIYHDVGYGPHFHIQVPFIKAWESHAVEIRKLLIERSSP